MRFWSWLRHQPKLKFCKRCGLKQREEHRHWVLDKDDPQYLLITNKTP